MKKLLIPATMFFLFSSCSNGDGVIDPNFYSYTLGLIFFSSFESGTSPSTSGWVVYPNYPSPLVSFSRDVPPRGGFWSINLHRVTDPDSQAEVGFLTSLSMSDTVENYVVSFWAKGKGIVTITVSDTSGGWYNGSSINASSWTFFADTLNRFEARYNTLEVYFYSWTKDSASSVLCLDNVKIFTRKPKSFVLANQSLKLTEVAVDDFAARQYAGNDLMSRYFSAMNYREQAVRSRSLAPVR